jgi:hypothetical protein
MIPWSSNRDSSGSNDGGEEQRRQRQHNASTTQAEEEEEADSHPPRSSISSTASAAATSKDSDAYHNPHAQYSQQQLDPHGFQQLERQEFLLYQQQQTTLQRSSPIAIVKSPGDGGKGVKKNSDSDSSDSENDDDDSEIDVEKDAIKLQKKYGPTIVQTYQATTSTDQLLKQSRENRPVLNAPYLGSRSRSANQVLSLPPMSLAGESMFESENGHAEPPETITSYGSLRDSHERGRFLDGPSSYREPTSGRIRQLDHRLRYHGRSSEMSIGERMQQSRKLKEIRQKEQAKQKEGAAGTSGDQKSGLAAMMNEASKHNSSSGDEAVTDTTGSYGDEMMMPIRTGDDETPTFRDDDQPYTNNGIMDAPSMLSTSLTAFEMLKMSNVPVPMALGQATSGAAVDFNGLVLPPAGLDANDQRRFQPLARSMSDPTPHLRQLSLRDANQQAMPLEAASAAAALAPTWSNDPQNMGMQMMPQQYHTPGVAVNTNFGYAPQPSTNAADLDPDTEGAFGDMDME